LARAAHPERRHGRKSSVIRDVFHNGKPRTAVGAVDKRVSVSAVSGVKQFGKTMLAGGDFRRDGNKLFFVIIAGTNHKIIISHRLDIMACDFKDNRLGGRRCFDLLDKRINIGLLPFNLNQDTGSIIAHITEQFVSLGQMIYKRTESNALHNTFDIDSNTCIHGRAITLITGIFKSGIELVLDTILSPPSRRGRKEFIFLFAFR
jgi:hypothetical protein